MNFMPFRIAFLAFFSFLCHMNKEGVCPSAVYQEKCGCTVVSGILTKINIIWEKERKAARE